jgi:hypothetical protein
MLMSVFITEHRWDFIIAEESVTDFAAEGTVKVCGFTPMKKNFSEIKMALRSVKPKETSVIPW